MAYFYKNSRILRGLCATVFMMLAACPMWAGSTTVVISQVYGAGGNSGATYNADFIELFNLSNAPVSLTGYAIQYGSATGTAISQVSPITGAITLQPGQHFLISGTPGTVGAALPAAADTVIASIALGGAAGRVFLTNSTTMLASSCPGAGGSVVDFVGYGTTDTCFEGTTFAPAPSATQSDVRTNPCADADQNGTDFSLITPAPHDAASTLSPCTPSTVPVVLSLTAVASPVNVAVSATALLTAVVTPATLPASTGITVTADTSALGGTTTQPLYDDGTHGDAVANDGTYSFSLLIPANQAAAVYTVNLKAVDAQLRTATASTSLTVHLNTPDFLFTLANTAIIVSGSTPRGTTKANVSMFNTFNQPVSFACSGLPAGSACIFSPATLTSSGSSVLEVTIDGAKAAAHRPKFFTRGSETMLAFTLLGLPLFLRRKLRSHFAGVLLGTLLLGTMLATLEGCGSSSTATGTNTITVTATGGSVSHTATFTLNVQ